MFWYILIISLGVFLLTMALCKTASREDTHMEINYKKYLQKENRGEKDDNT